MLRFPLLIRFVWMLAGFCLCCNQLFAQTEEVVLSTTYSAGVLPQIADDSFSDKMVIPLRRVQNLYLVEGVIDGMRGNFILDTGAPGLVLNSTYFSGAKVLEATAAYGVTGGGGQVYSYRADSLRIDSLVYRRCAANVADLSHIENARGVKVLGLIGAGLFANLEMEFDWSQSMLTLYRIDKSGLYTAAGASRPAPDYTIPIQITGDLYFIQVLSARKKLRFLLDTGAEVNVLNQTVPNAVLEVFSFTTTTSLKGSGATTRKVINGVLQDLYAGQMNLSGMTFLLTDLSALEKAFDTALNGMLGYAFFSLGTIVINPPKKELYVFLPQTDQYDKP